MLAPFLSPALWRRAPSLLSSTRLFKVKASVKKLCDACYIVKRRGRVFVLCKRDPKVRASVRGTLTCQRGLAN